MQVTIFGSSLPDDEVYQQAYEIGKLVAEAGHVLKNGGYGGTMEASAKGAQEAGGHVIGICVEGHNIDPLGHPNDYLDELRVKSHVKDRIEDLLDTDRIVALKGNVGTLNETFSGWVRAIVNDKKPVIFFGPEMNQLLQHLKDNNFLKQEHYDYVRGIDGLGELEEELKAL